MGTGALGLRWIVCRAETRPVTGQLIACPAGRLVTGATCLECRFLMTSSLERSGAGWCELPELSELSSTQLSAGAAQARRLAPVRMAAPSLPVAELQPTLPVVTPMPRPPAAPAAAELVAVGLA